MTRPFSRVIDAVAAIAEKLGATVVNKGDRLADNLEAIAQVAGSGGGALIVEIDGDPMSGFTLNKTAREIINALPLVYAKLTDSDGEDYARISGYQVTGNGYIFDVGGENFTAPTLDDYPHKGGVA